VELGVHGEANLVGQGGQFDTKLVLRLENNEHFQGRPIRETHDRGSLESVRSPSTLANIVERSARQQGG
jgi:hypothetical protein